MSAQSQVDLVVGIDFGMTCTGVAYSTTKMPTPRVIQKWPGRLLEANSKVPSSIFYWPRTKIAKVWGFESQHLDGTKEWFKRYLDPDVLRGLEGTARKRRTQNGTDGLQDPDIPDADEVRKWYRDYMSCLYAHVSEVIQKQTGLWESKCVEFIFSLPCTFTKLEIGRDILALIGQAGFGKGGERHTVELGLTEPEAAAVYTIKETAVEFKSGTTMLVCDAGGGTTDFAILSSIRNDEDKPELQELNVVEGQNVGSTNIDMAFEEMVEQRLVAVRPALPDLTAWSMMNSTEFLGWKCGFGQEDSRAFRSFAISVPTVDRDFNHQEAGIENGKMNFSQQDFRDLFDPEVEKIIILISKQLDSLRRKHRNKKLDYLILSGGLGSSAYIQSRLSTAFVGSRDQPNLQILVSEEPQLAVVKGIVIDRIQKLKSGRAVLKGRACRASYGIEGLAPYDKRKHQGLPVIKAPDGQLWAENQIDWIIKKGDIIDPEKPLISHHSTQFRKDEERMGNVPIVMSHNEPDRLPSSTQNRKLFVAKAVQRTDTTVADVSTVCTVLSDLSKINLNKLDMKKASSKLLNFRRQRYYEGDYDLKIIIGATDMKFELWLQGVKCMSGNEIGVEWDTAPIRGR